MSIKAVLTNKENWIFAGAQMLAGILNYVFQILAARQLTSAEFGQWSGWFAQFSFSLFVTIWVQSLMTIQGTLPFRLSTVATWAGVTCLVGLSVFSVFVGGDDFTGWAWMFLFSTFFGLALSHRVLIAAALGSLIISFSKFGFAFLFPHYDGYRWAILFGPAIAVIVLVILFPRIQDKASSPKTLNQTVILSSLFLAIATALIPQLDLLSAQAILSIEDLGAFAKVALIYKGIFFLLMILAQVLVTYQVRGTKINVSLLNLGALYILGILAALILPRVGFTGTLSPIWITGATIHIISLSLVFFLTQQEAASQRWSWPALWTGILAVEYGLARWAGLGLVNYWIIGIAIESLTIIAFFIVTGRQRRSG